MVKSEHQIAINDYEWVVTLKSDGEILFFLKVPYELSYAADPLWHSWENTKDELSTHSLVKLKITPIILFRKLVEEIIKLVKVNKLNFFYFQANTLKKGRLYNIITKRYLNNLPGHWECQLINDEWFYFRKR